MRPEHVRIQPTERVYGEKQLLHAQLDIISLTNHYEAYKSLRAEELFLKIALKNKVAEAKDTLAVLDKLLPKPAIVPKAVKQAHEHAESPAHKKKLSLQEEVEEIRRKLEALH